MIATKEEWYKIVKNCILSKFNAEIIIVDDCNFQCAECGSTPASKQPLDIKMFELFLKQTKQTNRQWEISLFGGEPTLRLDICEKVNYLSKKENYITNLITNGWWARDENIINQILKMNLDFMTLSVDERHLKFNTIENYQYIIDRFEKSNTKIWGVNCVSEEEFNNTKNSIPDSIFLFAKHPILSISCLVQKVIPLSDNCKHKGNKKDYKICFGVKLFPDGKLKYCCAYYHRGCEIHHVTENKLIEDLNILIDTNLINENTTRGEMMKLVQQNNTILFNED